MKYYLKKVRLNQGGYDDCGNYWGWDQPLWYYESFESPIASDHIRACDRENAKEKIKKLDPDAKFFR